MIVSASSNSARRESILRWPGRRPLPRDQELTKILFDMKDNWSARQNEKATAVAPPGRGVAVASSLGSGRTRLSVRLVVWCAITCLMIGAAGAAIIQLDTADVTIAAPVSGAPRIAMKHDGTGFVIVWQAADGGPTGPAGQVGMFPRDF